LKGTVLNFDLSSITAVNNDSVVYFRLIDNNNTAANGGVVGTIGSSRIDDFTISGVETVPEPAAWGAISGAGLLALCSLRVWRQCRCSEKSKS
jgi:hypothetical protein